MKKYVLGRVIRAIIAVFLVTSIAIIMIYTMIPREKIFEQDTAQLQKLNGKPDDITVYKNNKWEQLGYLDFVRQAEMCQTESDDYDACMIVNEHTVVNDNGIETKEYTYSEEGEKVIEAYTQKGYKVQYFVYGGFYATKDYSGLEIVFNFFKNLIKIDTPSAVQDPDNPDLERKIYIGTDYNGVPAIMCSGCEHNYLLYFDGNFPFIHQNFISLNFGQSYPTYQNPSTLDVINSSQGSLDNREQTYPNGKTGNSADNFHTCTYKATASLDHMDANKFDDNYANCKSYYTYPSMVSMSYIFGIISLVIAYAIAIPAGVAMARNKGKWPDKIGIVYVNIMIALPSLAFIYFMKVLGFRIGLPDKFPVLGFDNIMSYILPVIILALMSTASLMIWIRRYMVDQTNADYVKFARSKGLSQKEIFRKHILKNAIIPIVNGIPSSIILCISGSVITESVCAVPGMGKMLPDSIKALNNNMVITLTFIFTALSIFSILIGDLLMTVVDPRIQLDAKGGNE